MMDRPAPPNRGEAAGEGRIGTRALETRSGTIRFPAFVPVTRLGTRGGLDAKVQPVLASIAPAVMAGCSEFAHKNLVPPKLPVMVTSGSSVLLTAGAGVVRRGEIGEIRFASGRKPLTPEQALEVQETWADVAFTFDFPIPYGLDPIEAFRRQDLTIACALWALKARKRRDLPLYACVQGWDRTSYRQCANAYRKRGFAGLAVGGLSTRADSTSNLLSIVEAVLEEADGKPVHVFNVGDPRLAAALVGEEGVDSVSSNAWILLANEGRFWNNPSFRVLKPSAADKVLIALWNLSCATGRKDGSIASEIIRLEKKIRPES